MAILSLRDDDFFMDIVRPQDEIENKGKHFEREVHSYFFTKFRGFSSNWPYIAFQGLESSTNYLWLLNAN